MKRPYIPKEYLGAFKAGHRQSAREYIDEKLSYQLLYKIIKSKFTDTASMCSLAYITKFNNEYHKNVIKKNDPNALHNTDALRKDCYARENARNRDITSRENKFLEHLRPNTMPIKSEETIYDPNNIEDYSIIEENNALFNIETIIHDIIILKESIIKNVNTLIAEPPKPVSIQMDDTYKRKQTMAKKKKQLQPVIEAPKEVEISKDLQNSMGSLIALTSIHNLLTNGMFPYTANSSIKQALEFIESLHKSVLDVALTHEQAPLIPELQKILSPSKEGV